jgi:hypothetical protein
VKTLFALACAGLAAGCVGTYRLTDPTLSIRTEKGTELGVSTEHGVVFLGRTARAGRAEITAWFGDGESVESVVIEPVSPELCTAEAEIRLPAVPMSFEEPAPGSRVWIVGRTEAGRWEAAVEVLADPRAKGILTTIPDPLRGRPDQIGAGVFVDARPLADGTEQRYLVGLVSGVVTFSGADGTREYLAVLGPRELWQLVSLRRENIKKRRWIYRDDIL